MKNVWLAIGVLAMSVAISCDSSSAEPTSWPKQVLIIRHAEKLADEKASEHLSPEGTERAKALHQIFEKSRERPEPFAKPDFIFAAKDKPTSHRPTETVAPLAARLKLTVDAKFNNDDFEKLAAEVFGNKKYAGKTILICWRHHAIPELAAAFKATDAPKEWKETAFDRVWQITYENGKAKFHDLPQRLMKDDAKK
jgi:hypothetical protein